MTRPDLPFLLRRKPARARAASLALLALLALPRVTAVDSPVPAPAASFQTFTYAGHDAVFEPPLAPGHFRNPILTGFNPDPSICRVGEDYYLTTSTFAWFPGLPIYHSRDLVNWRLIGHAIDRPRQLDYTGLTVSRGLFAPAITHHDGIFYITCTMVGAGGNFVITATDPAGPWSDPVWLDAGGIDPSLFFDDDGRAWLVNNDEPPEPPRYAGHRAIWIQEFDTSAKRLVGPRVPLVNGGIDITKKPVWIEGPHIYKRDGFYYLCCAEGGTSIQHSQVILRSRHVTGPYEPWDHNPILTQRDLPPDRPDPVTCTGHVDMEIGPDGRWWAVFLGCRPYDGEHWTTGRETFLLPVNWPEGGWPVILEPGRAVPFSLPAPLAPRGANDGAEPPGEPVPSGNFRIEDDFSGAALSRFWMTLRTPRTPFWRTAPEQGLLLAPTTATLADLETPAFLARRVHHARFSASVRLTAPAAPGLEAGLALFQSEPQHFRFGLIRTADGIEVAVHQIHAGRTSHLAQEKIEAPEAVTLRVEVHDHRIRFLYTIDTREERLLLDDVDAYPITVQAAGGGMHFTGAVVGPYALAPIP